MIILAMVFTTACSSKNEQPVVTPDTVTSAPTAVPTLAPDVTPDDTVTAAPTEAPEITPEDTVTAAPTEAPEITPDDTVTAAPTEAPEITPEGPGFMEGVQFENLDAFCTWYEDGNLDGCTVTLNDDGTWSSGSNDKFLEGTFVGFGASAELYTYDGGSFATASPRDDVLYLTLSGEIENYFDTLEGDITLMKEEDSEHKNTVYVADYSPDEYFIGTWLCYDPENECLCDYGFELRTDGTYMDYPADSFSRPHNFDLEDEAIFVFDDDGNVLYTFYFDETMDPRWLVDDQEFIYFAQ